MTDAQTIISRKPDERDLQIIGAINRFAFVAAGIPDLNEPEIDLAPISLIEMCQAAERVERHNAAGKTSGAAISHFYMVPDQRLIAAVFALLHYDCGGPIICRPANEREKALSRWPLLGIAVLPISQSAEEASDDD